MQVTSVDNIDNKVLDKLKELYQGVDQYRVVDNRERLSFGKRREYFLISNHQDRGDVEWTFIWIGKNLWQFTYCNVQCMSEAKWKNPLDLLNELLNKK